MRMDRTVAAAPALPPALHAGESEIDSSAALILCFINWAIRSGRDAAFSLCLS